MTKLTLIIASLVLVGCTTVPVTTKFPVLPEELAKPCSELSLIADKALLSDVTRTVAENYSKFHDCKNLHNTTIQWYNEQKKIYESVKAN